MKKEEIIEKLNKVYELGKSHNYQEMIEDIVPNDAQNYITEIAEHIILSFNKQ